MSIQDNTEQVLRKIRVILSEAQVFDANAGLVILDKNYMLEQLDILNLCITGMMDEYDVTQRERDKSEREARRINDEIVRDAKRKAEDIYAASVMYTDEALRKVIDIMRDTSDSVKSLYTKMAREIEHEQDAVVQNKSELRSRLEDLKDTEKYMKLIDERNKELAKKKKEEEKEPAEMAERYGGIKADIKINQEYFDKIGMMLEEAVDAEAGGAVLPKEDKKEEEVVLTGIQRAAAAKAAKAASKKAALRQLSEETEEGEPLADSSVQETPVSPVKKAAASGGKAPEKENIPRSPAREIVGDVGLAEFPEEEKKFVQPEIRVNVNAEYFKWRESGGLEMLDEANAPVADKNERHPLFGRKKR